MKSCPQCSSNFDDDYVYCLNDGNVLAGADGEQETVTGMRFTGFGPRSNEPIVQCGACGLENRASAKFCKRCGAPTATSAGAGMSPTIAFGIAPARDPHYSSDPGPDPTVDLRRDLFTPPQPHPISAPQPNPNRNLIIGALAAGVVAIIVVAIILSGDKPASNNTNTQVANATNTAETALPKTFQRNYAGAISGKSLYLSLTRDGSSMVGEASTTRTDKLYGTINDDGSFSLDGYPSDGKMTGRYTGRINSGGSISGEWSKPDGTYPTPFTAQQQ